LLISHDINVVSQLADSIAVMRAGEIIETGNAKELMINPRYSYTRELIQSTLLMPKPVSRISQHEQQADLTTH